MSDDHFLAVRTLVAAMFSLTFACELFVHFGGGLVFIYLTIWTFALETVYFGLAVLVTLKARQARESMLSQPLIEMQPTHLPRLVKAMWFLYSIVLPMSWTITIAFWTLITPIWSPAAQDTSFLMAFEHFFNALFLLGELYMSRNAFAKRNIFGFVIYASTFICWSIVHDWAKVGVTEELACNQYTIRDCPIYPVLDWHHPELAGIVCVGTFLIGCTIYTAALYLTAWRNQLDSMKHCSRTHGYGYLQVV